MERTEWDNGVVRGVFDEGAGVATLRLAMPGGVNLLNAAFVEGLQQALDRVRATPGLRGIVLASAHPDFCAGADLDLLWKSQDPGVLFSNVMALHRLFRAIERVGVPVVAAITGSALGGGYELALACHRRIALDDPRVLIGLPEVQLGLFPGGGGTQRLPRLLGFQRALEVILQGRTLRAREALDAGLVDEVRPDPDAVHRAARDWLATNPPALQPWDRRDFQWPAPSPGTEEARNLFVVASAMLFKRTAGAFRAPELALCAVQQGAGLAFDRALEVEARLFVQAATGSQARDMVRTLWFHRNAAEKHEGLPHTDEPRIRKVAVLGAGMMGAGIAFLAARRGYEVALKDIRPEALDAAIAHCREELDRMPGIDPERRAAILDRLQPTLETRPLAGADLVIEAVFEDLELKHRVTREVAPLLSDHAIWASNTSAIPISDLSVAFPDPTRFVGLHFFSPVERMPLLEVVRGRATSDETVARALAFCKTLKKLPIVVNDRYGFYTTRVFSAYILEGAELVLEGHDPAVIEWAARACGMVVPPLQVFDEVSLTLGLHVLEQSRRYLGSVALPGADLIRAMVEREDRPGRAAGRGFYEYRDRKRVGLWSGLKDLARARPDPKDTGVEVLSRRLLLMQVAEAVRAVEDGTVRHPRDADLGAVFGIGFAPNTGGPLAWVDRHRAARVVDWMRDLAGRIGARYAPPPLLERMAANGGCFYP